ncbi:hypothetical protein Tco_1558468, partial [Tanacetum coccineum]
DDDGDSSGDDADVEDGDEDKEDEEEEEEEHLALAKSAVVVPTASISLPPEAEVERLLAMPTPPPSTPISLSPPFAGERLARIASTQALVDAVTAALPSPPLPPRDDIPKSTRGRRVDYGFVNILDAEERQRGIREVGYGIRDTWVDPAEAVPEITPMTVGEETVLIMKEEAYASLEALAYAIGLSQVAHYKLQTHREQQAEMAELRETDRRLQAQIVETLCVMRDMRREVGDIQAELLALREQRRRA